MNTCYTVLILNRLLIYYQSSRIHFLPLYSDPDGWRFVFLRLSSKRLNGHTFCLVLTSNPVSTTVLHLHSI